MYIIHVVQGTKFQISIQIFSWINFVKNETLYMVYKVFNNNLKS